MSEIDTLVAKLRQNPEELDKFLDRLSKPAVEKNLQPGRVFDSKRSQRRIAQILETIDKKGFATVADFRESLQLSSNTGIYQYLDYMLMNGMIVREDKSRFAAYHRPETDLAVAKEAAKLVEKEKAPSPRSYRRIEVSEKILEHASQHNGESYTITDMADAIGEHVHNVYKIVQELKRRKLLDQKFNRGPNKYLVATETPAEEEVTEATVDEPKECSDFAAQVEMLVWTFVRETRSTDLLLFLTWLEKR